MTAILLLLIGFLLSVTGIISLISYHLRSINEYNQLYEKFTMMSENMPDDSSKEKVSSYADDYEKKISTIISKNTINEAQLKEEFNIIINNKNKEIEILKTEINTLKIKYAKGDNVEIKEDMSEQCQNKEPAYTANANLIQNTIGNISDPETKHVNHNDDKKILLALIENKKEEIPKQ